MAKSIPGITIRPALSRQLAAYMAVMHLLSLVVLVAAPLPMPARLGLLGALALHAAHSYRLVTGTYAGDIIQAHIESDARVRISTRDGRELEAQLQPDTLVTPWLMIVRLRIGKGFRNKSLVLGNDVLTGEERRRLRVLLRFARLDAVNTDSRISVGS